jgi:hypothetical protein
MTYRYLVGLFFNARILKNVRNAQKILEYSGKYKYTVNTLDCTRKLLRNRLRTSMGKYNERDIQGPPTLYTRLSRIRLG